MPRWSPALVHEALVAEAHQPGPEGWLARLDLADLARLRRPSALRNVAALDALTARAEEQRLAAQRQALAAQLARIEAQQGRPAPGLRSPLERARAYLARAPGGISGDSRNPKAWSVVLLVTRGFALDEGTAIELLFADYGPRCKPALPRRELAGMVRRALRASRPPWGCLLVR